MSYTEYIAQIFSIHLGRFLHIFIYIYIYIYIYTHIGIFLDLQNVPCLFLTNNSSKVTTSLTSIIIDSVARF